jgi:hypothetical protein
VLQFTSSKGLSELANDGGFEGGILVRAVEALQEGIVGFANTGQIGKPSEPDTSLLLVNLWLTTACSGKLCKVQLIQEMISAGRGNI